VEVQPPALEWWLDVDGARLSVRAWQPDGAQRAQVFVVHGLGEHSGRYASVIDAMTAEGFAVIAYDLRGHGRSSGPRGHASSIGVLVADLNAVIADALRRIGDGVRIMYGHSMGGAIVLSHALGFPDTAVARIVTGPAIRPAFVPPAWKVVFGRIARRIAPSIALTNEIDPNGLSHDEAVVRAYRADPLVHDRVSAALGIGLLELGDELLSTAADLRVPVLVVHGDADPVTSAISSRQFAVRAGKRCRYEGIPGSLHEVHHETSWPDTWRLMSEWLDARLARRASAAPGR
jgi:alpha-beta hydrolase superfamily lysophospholipase